MHTLLKSSSETWLNQNLLENLIDGILLFSSIGNCLFINEKAQQICRQLNNYSSRLTTSMPIEILRIQRALADSKNATETLTSPMMLNSEIKLPGLWIRIRAQRYGNINEPTCILIMLEDQIQTLKQLAANEAEKYKLSERETEVWQLKRLGYTLAEIAKNLYISINTVKRHIKHINVKQLTNG